MAIDHRWDYEMAEARRILATMTEDIQKVVSSKKPGLSKAAIQKDGSDN